MKLCAPGSEGHNCAIVVRIGTNRCSLVGTGSADWIGAEHVMAWNIEQGDFPTEPAVYVIGSKRAAGRAVVRNSRGAAEPETRPRHMDYLHTGSPTAYLPLHTNTPPS